MAVKIRLARAGRKNSPCYQIVVADVRAPRDGRFKEKLGNYNPLLAKDSSNYLVIKKERIDYWLSVGAQPTTVVSRLLKKAANHISVESV